MDCSTSGFPVLHCAPEFAKIHVHRVGDGVQPYHSLLPPSPPALNLPASGSCPMLSALCIRWPKYQSFHFSISPSNEHSGLISFWIDWFDLLAVQRTLKESSPTPQFKSISPSVLSLLYGPTFTYIHNYWKNHSFDYMDLCWQINVSAF